MQIHDDPMYAVIDTETTGFKPGDDRVLELAIIGLNQYGIVEWEWCTLLNPGRPTKNRATAIHGITDTMLSGLPTFADYAGYIAFLLNQRVLVGHNVDFDWRFLEAEFELCGYDTPSHVAQVCTMKAARDLGVRPYKLSAVCEQYGIPFLGAHHALADARATAALAQSILDLSDPSVSAEVVEATRGLGVWPQIPVVCHEASGRPIPEVRKAAVKRPEFDRAKATFRDSVVVSADGDSPDERYLSVLDEVLDDRVITEREEDALITTAMRFGLDADHLERLHVAYLQELAGGMWSDGVIDDAELADLRRLCALLHLNEAQMVWAVQNPTPQTDE